MTYGEFKKKVEEAGVEDQFIIDIIDTAGYLSDDFDLDVHIDAWSIDRKRVRIFLRG